MSQVFYEKAISLFLHFLVLTVLIAIASLWLIFYVVFNHMIFYLIHFGIIFIAVVYGIKCYGIFRNFKESIHLFIPKAPEQTKHEVDRELKLKFDEECLDFCLKYRNGMTFRNIGRLNGNLEAQSVIHRIRRGLGILLKEYAKTHKHR